MRNPVARVHDGLLEILQSIIECLRNGMAAFLADAAQPSNLGAGIHSSDEYVENLEVVNPAYQRNFLILLV